MLERIDFEGWESVPQEMQEQMALQTCELERATKERDRLFAKHNFTITKNVPSDGDCQYHCVISELSRLKHPRAGMTTRELRFATASFIEDDPDAWLPFIVSDSINKLAQYVELVRGNEWGDQITLRAMSELLNVDVFVLATNYPEPLLITQGPGSHARDTIYLFNWSNMHYCVMGHVEPAQPEKGVAAKRAPKDTKSKRSSIKVDSRNGTLKCSSKHGLAKKKTKKSCVDNRPRDSQILASLVDGCCSLELTLWHAAVLFVFLVAVYIAFE